MPQNALTLTGDGSNWDSIALLDETGAPGENQVNAEALYIRLESDGYGVNDDNSDGVNLEAWVQMEGNQVPIFPGVFQFSPLNSPYSLRIELRDPLQRVEHTRIFLTNSGLETEITTAIVNFELVIDPTGNNLSSWIEYVKSVGLLSENHETLVLW